MRFIGIDVGTTHCKVALFDEKGRTIKLEKKPTITHQSNDGLSYYKPEEIWNIIYGMLKGIVTAADSEGIISIGIASMAETGLLVDKDTGQPRTEMVPWFDKRSMEQYELLCREGDERELFKRTGLYPSYKYGLTKILWFAQQDPSLLENAIWLSAADYIAYRLTGQLGTDYSLAARTYAYRIDKKEWDQEWLNTFGLEEDLFPVVRPSGIPLGEVQGGSDLPRGIKVAVAGHDHVCAALAVGAIKPGIVFDSIGTAETLVGALNERELGEEEYSSGLSYGRHVFEGKFFWMGGLSASGGSIEWLRKQLGTEPLSYREINDLLEKTGPGPTGIIYFPYLSGSGAPLPDPRVRGAFLGLKAEHGKGDLLKAVLEGTAFEMESIRRAARKVLDKDIEEFVAVGGGTRNKTWMKIKASISDCIINIPPLNEATLLGAALVAAIGAGVFSSVREAIANLSFKNDMEVVTPVEEIKGSYARIYEKEYLELQKPIRKYFSKVGEN